MKILIYAFVPILLLALATHIGAFATASAAASPSKYRGYEFQGKSLTMMEEVCKTSPAFVRSIVRSSILKQLKRDGVMTVSEKSMIDAVKQVTPKKSLDNAIKIMDRYKS